MIRSLLEVLSRRVVLKRSFPARFGSRQLYVSPAAGLRYWKPTLQHIDDGLFRLIDTFVKPGETVWDIGANLGLFTFASAHQVGATGKCLAIEPDVWMVTLLQRSAQLNNDLIIDILPVAVSDQVGIARFNIAVRSRATSFLSEVEGSTQTGGVRHTVLVPTTTLDTLIEQYDNPNFIKIDVETAEHLVLNGGRKLLEKVRPAIYCEITGTNESTIQALFQQYDYVLFDGDDPKFTPIQRPVCNTLALPIEHWYNQH